LESLKNLLSTTNVSIKILSTTNVSIKIEVLVDNLILQMRSTQPRLKHGRSVNFKDKIPQTEK
jgi:hypothetical protein